MRVCATYEASWPMLNWTIGDSVWMKMAVDHGNSVMTLGTTGGCVKIHKKSVVGGSYPKMDAVLFVVHI